MINKEKFGNWGKKEDGIYILDESAINKKSGEADEKSLSKANILYFTTKFDDPKLKNYQEDGMVWVELFDGNIVDIEQY